MFFFFILKLEKENTNLFKLSTLRTEVSDLLNMRLTTKYHLSQLRGKTCSADRQPGAAAQTVTTLQRVCETVKTQEFWVGRGTSKVERLEKAEAASEASLLLASSREWLPGGRR